MVAKTGFPTCRYAFAPLPRGWVRTRGPAAEFRNTMFREDGSCPKWGEAPQVTGSSWVLCSFLCCPGKERGQPQGAASWWGPSTYRRAGVDEPGYLLALGTESQECVKTGIGALSSAFLFNLWAVIWCNSACFDVLSSINTSECSNAFFLSFKNLVYYDVLNLPWQACPQPHTALVSFVAEQRAESRKRNEQNMLFLKRTSVQAPALQISDFIL